MQATVEMFAISGQSKIIADATVLPTVKVCNEQQDWGKAIYYHSRVGGVFVYHTPSYPPPGGVEKIYQVHIFPLFFCVWSVSDVCDLCDSTGEAYTLTSGQTM